MKSKISRRYGFKDSEFWDPCAYNTRWNAKFFYDGLVHKWPKNKKIVTNWPYSQNGLFLIKACQEAQEGCNIVSLINCRSTESATADRISALVFRRQILGTINFGNFPIGNGNSYSLIEFFRPELYDDLEIQNFTEDFFAQKPYLRDQVKSLEEVSKKSTNYDEDSIVQRLKQGWTTKKIQELYPIGNSTIGKIR